MTTNYRITTSAFVFHLSFYSLVNLKTMGAILASTHETKSTYQASQSPVLLSVMRFTQAS